MNTLQTELNSLLVPMSEITSLVIAQRLLFGANQAINAKKRQNVLAEGQIVAHLTNNGSLVVMGSKRIWQSKGYVGKGLYVLINGEKGLEIQGLATLEQYEAQELAKRIPELQQKVDQFQKAAEDVKKAEALHLEHEEEKKRKYREREAAIAAYDAMVAETIIQFSEGKMTSVQKKFYDLWHPQFANSVDTVTDTAQNREKYAFQWMGMLNIHKTIEAAAIVFGVNLDDQTSDEPQMTAQMRYEAITSKKTEVKEVLVEAPKNDAKPEKNKKDIRPIQERMQEDSNETIKWMAKTTYCDFLVNGKPVNKNGNDIETAQSIFTLVEEIRRAEGGFRQTKKSQRSKGKAQKGSNRYQNESLQFEDDAVAS